MKNIITCFILLSFISSCSNHISTIIIKNNSSKSISKTIIKYDINKKWNELIISQPIPSLSSTHLQVPLSSNKGIFKVYVIFKTGDTLRSGFGYYNTVDSDSITVLDTIINNYLKLHDEE